MRARTRGDMRGQARQYADAVNSQNTTDAQANLWLDQSIAILWRRLTKADVQRYMLTTTLTTTDALEYDFASGAAFSPTAADLMALLGVDLMSNDMRQPLEPFGFNDRATYSLPPIVGSEVDVRYTIRRQGMTGAGARLAFDRRPRGGTYEVHYIQAPQTLANDAATFDGIAGFEEWAILRVAILIKQRAEGDTSDLWALLKEEESSIGSTASDRDAGRAPVPAKVWGRRNRCRRGIRG